MTRSLMAIVLLAASPLVAQSAPFATHTNAELNQIQTKLEAAARLSPTGESGQILDDQGSHWLILVARAHTGEAELHNEWAD